jgi:hypothetical protein
MFTLLEEEDGEVVFLGPITQAMLMLRSKYEIPPEHAREAVLQAFFNSGDGISIDNIIKESPPPLYHELEDEDFEVLSEEDVMEALDDDELPEDPTEDLEDKAPSIEDQKEDD